MSLAERVRALLPPDGTDLVTFAEGRLWSRSGLVADDVRVEFVSREGETMGGRGAEGFYERWQDWLVPWESYRLYTEDVVERDDRVIYLVRLVGVTKRDGVEMGHEGAAVMRFEDGKVVEIVFSMDRASALAE